MKRKLKKVYSAFERENYRSNVISELENELEFNQKEPILKNKFIFTKSRFILTQVVLLVLVVVSISTSIAMMVNQRAEDEKYTISAELRTQIDNECKYTFLIPFSVFNYAKSYSIYLYAEKLRNSLDYGIYLDSARFEADAKEIIKIGYKQENSSEYFLKNSYGRLNPDSLELDFSRIFEVIIYTSSEQFRLICFIDLNGI